MFSTNAIGVSGAVVLIIKLVLESFGIVDIDEGTITKVVEGIIALVSIFFLVRNQKNRGDVAGFFFRR